MIAGPMLAVNTDFAHATADLQDLSIYDVADDGQRFVVRERLEGGEPKSIHVVENWYEEFRDREH